MTTTLLDYAVGNTLLALPVALIAWWMGRTQRHPSIAHLLWAFVLVRLLDAEGKELARLPERKATGSGQNET